MQGTAKETSIQPNTKNSHIMEVPSLGHDLLFDGRTVINQTIKVYKKWASK
jgi:hypothetical protein